MARHRAHEVQSQVTEGHKGIAKKTETLPRQDKSALVLFSLCIMLYSAVVAVSRMV